MHNPPSVLIEKKEDPLGGESSMNNEVCELKEKTIEILASVKEDPGDFKNREINTRMKEKTTKKDFNNINGVIDELMKQNMFSPEEKPFEYLWIANYIIYSVVAIFLSCKGRKKPPNSQQKSTQDKQQKRKDEYEGKAGTIKKELSIAKAELDLLDLMLEHTNCCKNKAGV